MSWYLQVLKKYAVFDGRARRREYWMFTLFNFFAVVLIAVVQGIAFGENARDTDILIRLYQLATFLPSLAVGVRRMHDTEHSGWWILFPIVNLVLAVRDGTPGENRYGPNPKNPFGGVDVEVFS